MQHVPLSSINRVMQRDSDGCPASLEFNTLCSSYVSALETSVSVTEINITYLLLLHEFIERYDAVDPNHQACILAIFMTWYKVIRKRELTRITAMTLQPSTPPPKSPDYPDLAGFDEEENNG